MKKTSLLELGKILFAIESDQHEVSRDLKLAYAASLIEKTNNPEQSAELQSPLERLCIAKAEQFVAENNLQSYIKDKQEFIAFQEYLSETQKAQATLVNKLKQLNNPQSIDEIKENHTQFESKYDELKKKATEKNLIYIKEQMKIKKDVSDEFFLEWIFKRQ